MAELAREMAARQEEAAARISQMRPPQETAGEGIRPPSEKSRPFRELRSGVLRQVAQAAEYKPVEPLSGKQRETLGDVQRTQKVMGELAKRGVGYARTIERVLPRAVPTVEIPESGMLKSEEYHQLEQMKLPKPLHGVVERIGPKGFEQDIKEITEGLERTESDPVMKEVADALSRMAPVTVKNPELAAWYFQNRLHNLGINTPEKLQAFSEMAELYHKLNELSERINYFVSDLATKKIKLNLTEDEQISYLTEMNEFDGKNYLEAYHHAKVFEPIDPNTGRSTKKMVLSDDIIAAKDPQYAEFVKAMDLITARDVRPDFTAELQQALGEKVRWAERQLEGGKKWAEKASWYNPFKYIAHILVGAGKISLPAAKTALAIISILDELPTDIIGMFVTWGKIGKKAIMGEEIPEEYWDELYARYYQTFQDILSPLPVQYEPKAEQPWQRGAHAIHMAGGKWSLPEEMQARGFAWSDNPWVDFALKQIFSLQWFTPPITQAGELRKSSTMLSKIANYTDELADTFKTLVKYPNAENLKAFRDAFQRSGLVARIVQDAKKAAKAGESIDWVKPTAKVLAKVDDERQLAKIVSNSMSFSAQSGFFDDVLQAWKQINAIADEAKRIEKWSKYLTEAIAQLGAIPVKPGIFTRFPTTHPTIYKTLMEGITGESSKSPLTASWRKAYARLHPSNLQFMDLESAETPGMIYGYLLNQGVTPREANRWVSEFIRTNPLDRGEVVMRIEKFLRGDELIGISGARTFASMRNRLFDLAPVIDPSDARRIGSMLDSYITEENRLYDEILEHANKVWKTPDEFYDALGGARDMHKGYINMVKTMKNNGDMTFDVAKDLLDRLDGLGKAKKAFIAEVKDSVGRPERLFFAPRRGTAEGYQAKVQHYGVLELKDEATGRLIARVDFTSPMTVEQLKAVERFDRNALYEIYRFNHKNMTEWLKAKDFGRKFGGEVRTILDRLTQSWKKYLIYPRSKYIIQTYLSSAVKSFFMGALDVSDIRAYNKLMKYGMVVLDDGTPILVGDEVLRLLNNMEKEVLGKPAFWRERYTGSWLVGESVDDPYQAVTNFLNQYLYDDGVRILITRGDNAFLHWLNSTPEGQKMLRTWKPALPYTNKADIAQDYLLSLKGLLKQTQERAPGAYKAMLYVAGINKDPSTLPGYFQKVIKKNGRVTRGDVAAYLKARGVQESFLAPMVKRPFWETRTKVANWIDREGEGLYNAIFFRGATESRKLMYKSLTMDYARQLMSQGLDETQALAAAARHASKTTRDLCLDFSRQLVAERKAGFLSPFLTAFRLDLDAWLKMVGAKPGLASLVVNYYQTAYNQSKDLPPFLRWTMPVKIGGGTYNLNIPMILLAPWSYSLPTMSGESPYEDIWRGFLGPIPRTIKAEIEARPARKRIDEIVAEIERGDISPARAKELSKEMEGLEWKARGALSEISSALMGTPEAGYWGWRKGEIKAKIDRVPEDAREPGWTEEIFESLSTSDKKKIRKLMSKWYAYHEGRTMADRDEAFLWAVEQLPGEPLPGAFGAITGAITGAAGKMLKLPGTYYPEEIQEGYKLMAASRRGERAPYYTETMLNELGERISPYEQQRYIEERMVKNVLGAGERALQTPAVMAAYTEPERYPELRERIKESPDLWRPTREDIANRRALADAAVASGLDIGEAFGMRRPSEEWLESIGYKGGKPTEALELYRQYEDEGKPAGLSWQSWLALKAEKEHPYDAAAQQKLLSHEGFYPYLYPPSPTPSSIWYGAYQQQVIQPYFDIINEISRLRDLKKGHGATDMTPAEIDERIAELQKQLNEMLMTRMPVPNLEYRFDPDLIFNILRMARGEPAEDRFKGGEITTEQLREMAGLPPLEESTMPSAPMGLLASRGVTGDKLDKYVRGLVLMTSTPYKETRGKSKIEVDMETAMLISGMSVKEIKENRGRAGLGKPWYDETTKKVYLTSIPINWLDEETQALIRANVDDETWAKIQANAYEPGGGRRGGRGWGRGRGFATGRGFTKEPSPSYTGPVTETGESKADIFFTLPKSQRTAYLDANPDLKAYFRRQKEGETDEEYRERLKLMDLADRYYHILDPQARRGFLRSHPELLAYFETMRQKRDKYYMQALARAFALNPDLWEIYLEKQNELTDAIIANMRRKGMGKVGQPKESVRNR